MPATTLLAAGYAWGAAIRKAERLRGPFDVAVVLLARLDPWVFHHLEAPRKVLDAVDALGVNMTERAAAAGGLARWLWQREARRTVALERDAGRRYERVVVVTESERKAFGERAVAITHGVELLPLEEGTRDIDAAFWGRLAYFANDDAVRFILDEIWPEVRALRPGATLLIGGAAARRWMRRHHGRDGVTVASPLPSREKTLRRVKVALLPVRFGSGQSNQVLEAAEAGCAVVSTPSGMRGLAELQPHVMIEQEPRALAARVAELLAAPERASRAGRELRALAEAGLSRELACSRLAELVLGGAAEAREGESR